MMLAGMKALDTADETSRKTYHAASMDEVSLELGPAGQNDKQTNMKQVFLLCQKRKFYHVFEIKDGFSCCLGFQIVQICSSALRDEWGGGGGGGVIQGSKIVVVDFYANDPSIQEINQKLCQVISLNFTLSFDESSGDRNSFQEKGNS